jgi:hypothetical protein
MAMTHPWDVTVQSAALGFVGTPAGNVSKQQLNANVSITSVVHGSSTAEGCVRLKYNFGVGTTSLGICYGQGKAVPAGTDVTFTDYFKFVNPWDENLIAAGTSGDPLCIKMPDNSLDWDASAGGFGISCTVGIWDYPSGSPPNCSGTPTFVESKSVLWNGVSTLALWGARMNIATGSTYVTGPVTEGQNYQITHLVISNTGRCYNPSDCSNATYRQRNGTGNVRVAQFTDASHGGETTPANCNNCLGNYEVFPGSTVVKDITGNAPSSTYSGGKWYLGARVWSGLTEDEPNWDQGLVLSMADGSSNVFVDLLLIAGIIGIPLYLGLKK